MGGKKSPIAAITKAVEDTAQTVGKGFKDTVDTGIKAADDTVKIGTLGIASGSDIINEAGDKLSGGSIVLDPMAKQTEAAKDAKRQAARDAAAAQERQTAQRDAELKVRASNAEASEGSSIILGGKRKKKKGSAVSSGMGLSTGDTGLQV